MAYMITNFKRNYTNKHEVSVPLLPEDRLGLQITERKKWIIDNCDGGYFVVENSRNLCANGVPIMNFASFYFVNAHDASRFKSTFGVEC